MLVFLSDLHLTDGSVSLNINADAFKKFRDYLNSIPEDDEVKEITIVLLGDIFDILRSSQWSEHHIRPWKISGTPEDREKLGKIVKDILVATLRTNCEAIRHLNNFRRKSKYIVNIVYIIGNHDWLINIFPETVSMMKRAFGLQLKKTGHAESDELPNYRYFKDYGVIARHGDILDSFNRHENRDSYNIGDAFVIDFLNTFTMKIQEQFDTDKNETILSALREIDNVRPFYEVPAWIQDFLGQMDEEMKDYAWDIALDSARTFLECGYWKVISRVSLKNWFITFLFSLFKSLLKSYIPFRTLRILLKHLSPDICWENEAIKEKDLSIQKAEFIVYGHTHDYKTKPLKIIRTEEYTKRVIYFNTGTWRKIHQRTVCNKQRNEFLNWHIMTFIAFYREKEGIKERKNRKFEVWHGVLDPKPITKKNEPD